MKIYDCFSYWDEDLLLDLRLNVLNNFIDYFVIVEGNKTWQNNFKKLRFDINKFSKFKDKIIYIPVEDMPDGDNPYIRENFQRNCISRGLENSNEEDLIIALSTNIIAGAGIDVYEKEPLPSDHKLRFLSNALLLPHLGYVTAENYSIFYTQMLENLDACVNGKPTRIIE